MPQEICLTVNGQKVSLPAESSVAAALLKSGTPSRRSVLGEERMPFCGMGICMECRATVNGVPHQRTCLLQCEDGMEVRTG